MKKILPLLMIVCLLGSFAACGQQEEAVAIITPEPISSQSGEQAEQAQVVVPDVAPADQGEAPANGESADSDQDRRNDSGSTTTNTNTNTNTDDGGNTDDVDKLSVAMGYIGSSLSALQSAIGAPNSSEYVVSCIETAAQEGLLYYDGFMVWTIQYNDGSEIVKGVS